MFPSRQAAPLAQPLPTQQVYTPPGQGLAPPMQPPAQMQPPAMMPPQQAAPEMKVHVSQNGQPAVLMPLSHARQLPPNAMAISEDQSSGWLQLGEFLAKFSPAAAPPMQPPAQMQQAAQPTGRGAFGAPATPQNPQQSAPPMQSVVPRGMFAAVGNAQVTRQGSYINSGDYICKVIESQFKSPNNGGGGFQGVIVELEVLQSSYDPNDPAKQKCNQIGSRMSAFVKQNQSFAGNMKEIMLAVSGMGPDGKPRPEDSYVTEDECMAFVGPTQPYAGVLVYLEARDKPLQNQQGQLFTKVSWWPCPAKADGSPDEEKLFRDVR